MKYFQSSDLEYNRELDLMKLFSALKLCPVTVLQ